MKELTCPGGHMTPTLALPVGTPPPEGHRTRPAALRLHQLLRVACRRASGAQHRGAWASARGRGLESQERQSSIWTHPAFAATSCPSPTAVPRGFSGTHRMEIIIVPTDGCLFLSP